MACREASWVESGVIWSRVVRTGEVVQVDELGR